MAVQLKGQTTWDAKAKEARAADEQVLCDTYGITQEDVVRVPKSPTKPGTVLAKPLSVNSDGSVTCSVAGKLRAIAADKIEVKGRGPRGGRIWLPLVAK